MTPRTTGCPGRTATPWTSSSPRSRTTDAVKSSEPAEEPALTATASHSRAAVATASAISAGSSATMGLRSGSPPHSVTCPASISELYSTMSPLPGAAVGGTSSLPVGMIATRGRRRTGSEVTPPAAAAPTSSGRMVWFSGSTSSVATMSSPMGRTCCQGAAGAMISMSPPASWITSRMITASKPSGMGSPVSTQTACGPTRSRMGAVSMARTVSAARTAAPSMAAAW